MASMYKKSEDGENAAVAGGIDKMTVFQDSISVFNSSRILPRKTRSLLAKIVYLMLTGSSFPPEEATQLFFSITKLFQSKDPALRQMVYLTIKLLSRVTEDAIMVTQSIIKDTSSTSDAVYRPNAIRTLCRVIDASTIQSIDRLIKTAIVDKNPSVSSAALISSYHLLSVSKDVVKRWANEVQDTVLAVKTIPSSMGYYSSSGSSYMTQYHALGLLYQLRSHDRMALVKMIQQFSGQLKSPPAIALLIRFIGKVINEDKNMRKSLYNILESWLKHKSDLVNFEAAKVICEISNISDEQVAPAISVLQLFLTSPRYVSRFSAIRILNRFSMIRPNIVNPCNIDIENLISDSNRSIATYAITTLLKTGNEASVDRLLKQLGGFMNDIADEFKIIVVDAVRSLCLKFPSKQASTLSFLYSILRDEGGYEFKRVVVEALFDMVKFVPESRNEALAHLCEFIEDCEFTRLAIRILHFLGIQGPYTNQPTKFIRYIYNRIVLENALVRAAAVSALSKFMLIDDENVKNSVKVLLTRSLDDIDDEVRDRAAFALGLLESNDKSKVKNLIAPNGSYSLSSLEHQLVVYVSSDNQSAFDIAFDMSKVPLISQDEIDSELFKSKTQGTFPTVVGTIAAAAGSGIGATTIPQQDEHQQRQQPVDEQDDERISKYGHILSEIPEINAFGQLQHSSKLIALTESETEYVVKAIKHMFKSHIVIQYNVGNTLPDTQLENVSVVATPTRGQGDEDEEEEDEEDDGDKFQEEFTIPIEQLGPEESGTVYVAFKRPEKSAYPKSSFINVLTFKSKEIDPNTKIAQDDDGYEDEYQVEDVEIIAGDYIIPNYIGNFQYLYDQLGVINESSKTFALCDVDNLNDGIKNIIDTLSMIPVDGSNDDNVSRSSHTLKLSGKTIDDANYKVLAIVKMVYNSKNGLVVKMTARSQNSNVSALVINGLL